MTFSEMGLTDAWAKNLERLGISEPTPIQQEVFAPIVEGRSVLGLSKTGTGKTLGYMAPLLQRYFTNAESVSSRQKILVLVPTRELASQVLDTLDSLSAKQVQGVSIVGGESEDKQISVATRSSLIVATPGRLLDLLKRRLLDVREIKALVYDEADRLLDMGFIDDIREIVSLLPKGLQMCFFSATLHFGVDEMAYEMGIDFMRFGQESEQITVEGLDHQVAFVGDHEKFHALTHFVHSREKSRGIIFSNYRERAHEISSRLRGLGYRVEGLTAQLPQGARVKIMEAFRSAKLQVLVASDLAARGLDVDDIDYVINFDLPEDPSTYVHRVGRTARAGRDGMALSLVGFEDAFRLEKLEKFLGHSIQRFRFELEQFKGPLPRAAASAPVPRYETVNSQRSAPHSRHSHDTSPSRPRPSHQIAPSRRTPQPAAVNKAAGATTAVPVARPSLWQRLLAFFGFQGTKAVNAASRETKGASAGSEGRGRSRGASRGRRRSSGPSSSGSSAGPRHRPIPRGR